MRYYLYCYLEFKIRYLKNLKWFSIRIKEFFKPIVLKKKTDEFLLFLKAFSSQNRSLSNALEFYGKKKTKQKKNRKIGKRNLYWKSIE